MARIRGKDTSPEVNLRKLLWQKGTRYRLHIRVEECRPDIVFLKKRIVVFVDGCFWHGCPEHYVRPRTQKDFWAEKLTTNVARDRRQTIRLKMAGWIVLRYWEHEIASDVNRVANEIISATNGITQPDIKRWIAVKVIDLGENQEAWQIEDFLDPSTQLNEVRERRGPKLGELKISESSD